MQCSKVHGARWSVLSTMSKQSGGAVPIKNQIRALSCPRKRFPCQDLSTLLTYCTLTRSTRITVDYPNPTLTLNPGGSMNLSPHPHRSGHCGLASGAVAAAVGEPAGFGFGLGLGSAYGKGKG